MDVQAISRELVTTHVGTVIRCVDVVDSTNDEARRQIGLDPRHGWVMLAETQTRGRGRQGRSWESAAGLGIWASIVVRAAGGVGAEFTALAGLAVCEACEATATGAGAHPILPVIKWPNDILLGGKKVSGILIETTTDRTQEPWAILGIGINVNHTLADFSPDVRLAATSLALHLHRPVPREPLAAHLLNAIGRQYEALEHGGRDGLMAEWIHRCATIGHWVRVETPEGPVEGLAEAIDHDGGLVVRSHGHAPHRILVGDVVHLREVIR